ncbi:hypothetical protein HCC61_29725 [Streptomyces sp. HNM0575]|uniref:HAAS signaling domain-containing protein n=1 Tax=Streptomyces sp. HNM0575 TaxID=2716338 RepID=UPI00145E79E9|nr:hypothetical protein [Streptomyces sp. HNM0575]NLU76751.1 hypothetical protein [Streptomyces sp. HNM0575]
MTSTGDQLVEEYLRRFDNASVFLTDERRAELRQEIVEHITAGVEEAEAAHADAVRAVLDRLGPPADIVASETGPGSAESAHALGQEPPAARESAYALDKGGPAEDASASAPPAPPAPARRFSPLLIGAVVTAVVAVVVIGTLAFGMTSSDTGVQPSEQRPPAPSESSTPGSETPSSEPTETPTETPTDTPSESPGDSTSPPSEDESSTSPTPSETSTP